MWPAVKKYLNAYQFLQDCYQFRKKHSSRFSYDLWAKELNANNKSYVRMMVLGKRPINTKMIEAFANNLGLESTDRDYFFVLVQYTQSKSQENKNLFGQKLIALLRTELDQLEIQQHYDFLSNPLLPRLQVCLSFHDLDQEPNHLAWLLGVSSIQIDKGLQKLVELGLIVRRDGRYHPLKKSFKIPDQFGDLGLELFYTANLEAAKEAIRLPKEKRRFKSLFLPLNKSEFEEFLKNLQNFAHDQLSKFNADQYADRALYQVHFNIIPVSTEQPSHKNKFTHDGFKSFIPTTFHGAS